MISKPNAQYSRDPGLSFRAVGCVMGTNVSDYSQGLTTLAENERITKIVLFSPVAFNL